MPTKTDKSTKFSARDFDLIAEHVLETYQARKSNRKDIEAIWKDIDRQVNMIPEVSHKYTAGKLDPSKAWMPEMELPLQAQTLEVLNADTRRMLFPDSGPWFASHSALTDDYLSRVEFASLITGDQNDIPSIISQDNADKLVQGVIESWHRQYDFGNNIDLINTEAFKYGVGIGRGRVVNKRVFLNTARGMTKIDTKIPVLVPRSIKDTYLDDSKHFLMNEGHILGPSVIHYKCQSFDDLVMAAKKGKNDPEDEDGGWMPNALKGMKGNKKDDIELIEMEGDLIVPKSEGSLYLPNCIVTLCMGYKGDKTCHKVVRLRFRKKPYSSYIEFPYQHEHLDTAYSTSPLMKGWPVAKAAADALNKLIMSGALKIQPPIGYNRDDMAFALEGGPVIYPGASWATTDPLNIYDEVGGDPSAMSALYVNFLNQYADVTGISQPRLGAQTISHTTAFAKEAELSRGVIRTVDYVRGTLKGPLTKWLYMAYDLGKPLVKDYTFFIESYNGFVTIESKHLPDDIVVDAFGSGGPAEEREKTQQRLQALQFALQLDTMNVQLGGQPKINLGKMIEQVLREGKWTDIDLFLNQDQTAAQPTFGQLPGILTGEMSE